MRAEVYKATQDSTTLLEPCEQAEVATLAGKLSPASSAGGNKPTETQLALMRSNIVAAFVAAKASNMDGFTALIKRPVADKRTLFYTAKSQAAGHDRGAAGREAATIRVTSSRGWPESVVTLLAGACQGSLANSTGIACGATGAAPGRDTVATHGPLPPVLIPKPACCRLVHTACK